MHSDDDEERAPDASEAIAQETAGPGEAHSPAPPGEISPLGARLAALFEVLCCSGLPTQILIQQVLLLAGIRPHTAGRDLSTTFVVALTLSDAAVMVGLVLWFLHVHGERPSAVLFRRRPLWREAVLGVVLIPIVFFLVGLVLAVVRHYAPGLHNVVRNPFETLIRTPSAAVLFGLVVIFGGGVREEVQRAFILHRFEQYLGGAPVGLLIFSVVFGAGHVIQGWDVAVATASLGLFWGVLYLIRRSIVAPMVSHAGFDLAEIIGYTLYGS